MFYKRKFSYARSGTIASACIGILISTNVANALSLQQALARAESASPKLEGLRAQQAAASARVSGAAGLPDPKLQLTYFGESVETRTGPQESIYSLSQTVPWLSKLRTRKLLAQSHAHAVIQGYRLGLSRLQRDVIQHYIELAYLEKALVSTRANLELIADTYSIVEAQVQAGGALNALLRLEVEKERIEDNKAIIRLQQIEQRAALAALLSMEESELKDAFVFPELPSIDDQTLSERSFELSNPELSMLRQRVSSLDEKVSLSRLSRYPDFTLGLNYIQVGNRGAAPDAGTDPWAVTFAVNLPIWETKNRSQIQASMADKRVVEMHYRERELQLKAELSSLLAKRSDNQQRTQRYEQTLIPLAEQALENSRSAYQSNQISVLELIDSERALLELNLNYWRAVANALQANAGIRALVSKSNEALNL